MTKPPAAERFEKFHADNPHVYRLLIRLARQWRARFPGLPISMCALVNKARWEINFSTTCDEEFKINNTFGPFYSRLLAAQETDLAEAFNDRVSQADEWIRDRST